MKNPANCFFVIISVWKRGRKNIKDVLYIRFFYILVALTQNPNLMKKLVFSLIFLTVYCIGFSQMPADSLKAYYPFNGNANDESGNENHGTVIGATLTTDRFGNENSAYLFDGLNDFIQLPSDFDLETRTVCVWFNAESIGYFNRIFTVDHPDLQYGSTKIMVNAESNADYLNMTRWVPTYHYEIGISKEAWNFAVLSINGNTLKYYLNGLFMDSLQGNYIISDYGEPKAFLGVSSLTDSRFFDGKIDDLRVYDRELSAKEVLRLYTEDMDDLYNYDTIITYETDTITVYDSIAVTDTLMVDVSLAGLEDPHDINRIKVFPNPANEIININTGAYENMVGYSLRITNAQAQTVFESLINEQEFQIEVNDFGAEGLYFLRIISPSQEVVEIKKIILL
jgi:hypothetical protein